MSLSDSSQSSSDGSASPPFLISPPSGSDCWHPRTDLPTFEADKQFMGTGTGPKQAEPEPLIPEASGPAIPDPHSPSSRASQPAISRQEAHSPKNSAGKHQGLPAQSAAFKPYAAPRSQHGSRLPAATPATVQPRGGYTPAQGLPPKEYKAPVPQEYVPYRPSTAATVPSQPPTGAQPSSSPVPALGRGLPPAPAQPNYLPPKPGLTPGHAGQNYGFDGSPKSVRPIEEVLEEVQALLVDGLSKYIKSPKADSKGGEKGPEKTPPRKVAPPSPHSSPVCAAARPNGADWNLAAHKGRIEFLFPLKSSTCFVPIIQLVCDTVKGEPGLGLGSTSETCLSTLKDKNSDGFFIIRVRDSIGSAFGSTPFRLEVMLPLKGKGTGMLVVTAEDLRLESDGRLMQELYKMAGGHIKMKVAPGGGMTKQDPTEEEVEDLGTTKIVEKLQELGVVVQLPEEATDEILDGTLGYRLPTEKAEKMWAGVAGYEDTKAAVKQCVTLPLIRPDLFQQMAKLTRGQSATGKSTSGVLFTGPPGVGKTSMAKIAAHVASVALIYVPIESVVSKWYGEAEQKLRAVFETTRKLGRAVLFLDELDAFAGSRDQQMSEVTRRILSVLLRHLDGLENDQSKSKGAHLVLVGATNRPGDLDPALRSRFNKMVDFPLPPPETRALIFGTYATTLNDAELGMLGEASEGFAGRDIRECCDDAEHLHVAKILEEGGFEMTLDHLEPPSAEAYLEAIHSRQGRKEEDGE